MKNSRTDIPNFSVKGNLAIFLAYTIFGINIVTTKDISNAHVLAPIALFTFRALGATVLFWLVSIFTPREKVDSKDYAKIALASFFGLFITQFSFLKAITMATPVNTSIIGTLTPIFTMFFAFLFVKEPITGKKAAGVLLSFAGVIFLILNSVHSENGIYATKPLGYVLLFVNAMSFALYLGAFRPLIQKYSVVTFMKWMFLFSLLMSLPFSAKDIATAEYSEITTQVWVEIGFLILCATFIAYFLIPLGQKTVRPTMVAMYTYLQPIIAMIISVSNGMDVITWRKAVAIVMVFAGVAIVNKSRSAAASSSSKE